MSKKREKEKDRRFKKWLRNNIALFITAMVPVALGVISFLTGKANAVYLYGYYSYFDIDMKYVSINENWNIGKNISFFSGLSVIFLAMFYIYSIYHILFRKWNNYYGFESDEKVHPKISKYFRRKIIGQSIYYIVMSFFFLFVVFYLNTHGSYPYQEQDDYSSAMWTSIVFNMLIVFSALFLMFNKTISKVLDYKPIDKVVKVLDEIGDPPPEPKPDEQAEETYYKIFPDGDKSSTSKYINMQEIYDFQDKNKKAERIPRHLVVYFYSSIACAVVLISMSLFGRSGWSYARNQREFLVTEDNKHIAIPVSEDKYALIEIKEYRKKLTLLIGKQDFHDIDDYPCIRKTYQEVEKEVVK